MHRRGFLTVAAAAAAAPAVPAFAQSALIKVRVGDALGDPYAQGYYAVDEGLFKKAGLDVDFQLFTGGSAISQAVNGGMIDFGISTPIQIANAVEHGIPFIVVAPAGLNTVKYSSGQLIVAKNGPIQSAKDLEGKTVALNALRTVSELALLEWLKKGGADPSKVKLVEMIFGEMGPAVERGTIAAGSDTEPALSLALKSNGVRVLANTYTSIAPQFLISAWFTTQDFARKNPEACRRFATAILESAKWANTHFKETGDILVKYGKLDPDLVRSMQRVVYADAMRLPEMQVVLDEALAGGLMGKQMQAADLIFKG